MFRLIDVWKFFSSVKLTVVILLTLAAASIIGTLIPQNAAPAEYIRTYGEFGYRFFSVLDLFDMYRSWWFLFLLSIMTVNIVVCSIDRLRSTWNIIFVKRPLFSLERFKKLAGKKTFAEARPPVRLMDAYVSYVARRFGYHTVEETGNGFVLFAERRRWTRLGVYAVHLSIIFLLVGAMIGSLYGFEGFVTVPEGETVSEIRLRNTGASRQLPFKIFCEDFDVSFYDSGSPKEFRSSLAIVEGDTVVRKKDIIVNDPLRYKGINIFQSSYGRLAPETVTLSFTGTQSGLVYRKTAKIGESIELPEKLGTFVVNRFMPSADFRGHSLGETFLTLHTPPGGQPKTILLPVHFPTFDKMRKGEFTAAVEDFESRYYTGLQVTRDPGVSVVYTGFILMILGCVVSFFMSHQRICIEVTSDASGSRVTIAGSANKNKLSMENKVAAIAEKLKSQTEG